MASAIKTPSRRRETVYLSLVLLPLALATITLLVGFVREAIYSAQVNQIVAKLKIAGEPVDSTSLALANKLTLPAAEVAESIRIANAAEHLKSRYSTMLRKFQGSLEVAPPSLASDGEELLIRYSKDAQPMVEAIEDKNFASSNALYILERERDLAYHQGDTPRAIEMLKKIGTDEEFILKSLEFDVWTAEDLNQLREIVGAPSDPDTAWRKSISKGLAQFLEFVDLVDANVIARRGNELMHPFGIAPSHVLSQLLLFHEAEQLRAIGTRNARNAAESIECNSAAFSLVAVPMARSNWINGYRTVWLANSAEYAWKSRMTKRRVLTALAIKQFKLQEGRWPESLDKLTKVGLTSSDWKISGDQDFGYRVIEDGNAALLWTGGTEELESPKWFEKSFRTPSQPPFQWMLNASTIAELQSTIR